MTTEPEAEPEVEPHPPPFSLQIKKKVCCMIMGFARNLFAMPNEPEAEPEVEPEVEPPQPPHKKERLIR